MTPAILKLIIVLLCAVVCFAFEWTSADVVALGVLLALVLLNLISPEQAFAGFGSGTVLMILGLLILTAALLRTGVVDMAGRAILQRSGKNPERLLLVIMTSVAVLSAFISNTAATAFFLPVVFGIASKANHSVSRYLMPLAFASILTSSVTLVSTSTNLVVSGLMTSYGLEPMGMFEPALVGIPIAVIGIAYLRLATPWIIPVRGSSADDLEEFIKQAYLSEVLILPDSTLTGKTIRESKLEDDLEITVLRVIRNKDQYMWPSPSLRLEVGDVLLIEGPSEGILKIKDKAGIDIKADVKLSDPGLQSEDASLVEVLLLPRSPLIGRTLKSHRFRERYGLQVLAVNRPGGVKRKISQILLRMGDVLLVQGRRTNIKELAADRTFRILSMVEDSRPNVRRAWVAISIFAGALATATFNLLPLPVAVLLGAFLVFVTQCLTPEEAYREIEWKALILIGCMLAVGAAMAETGADQYLARTIVHLAGGAGPLPILGGFFILTLILTQPMSNQAAAVVVTPVAIRTALELGLNPRTFAMMVAVAASCSYLTPLEPSCLLVCGPGHYRFIDFVKAGGFLTLIIFVIAVILVPIVWPLRIL